MEMNPKARATGEVNRIDTDYDGMADMPDVVPGQHRWYSALIYTLTHDDVLGSMMVDGHEPPHLTPDKLVDIFTACTECGARINDNGLVVNEPCPGQQS